MTYRPRDIVYLTTGQGSVTVRIIEILQPVPMTGADDTVVFDVIEIGDGYKGDLSPGIHDSMPMSDFRACAECRPDKA